MQVQWVTLKSMMKVVKVNNIRKKQEINICNK